MTVTYVLEYPRKGSLCTVQTVLKCVTHLSRRIHFLRIYAGIVNAYTFYGSTLHLLISDI